MIFNFDVFYDYYFQYFILVRKKITCVCVFYDI